jgi:hypothetical protein
MIVAKSRNRFVGLNVVAGLVLALVLAMPADVNAAPAGEGAAPPPAAGPGGYPDILRPSTRSMFGTFWLGGTFGLNAGGSVFKMGQEFGWHWSGDFTGGAIGAYLHESFAGGAAAVQLGPKFWWDFQIMDGLGLYISPSVAIGIAIAGGGAAFDMNLGCEAKLALADRGFVSFKPIGINIVAGGGGALVGWDFLFGGGVMF